jgi:hypothetical protein
VSDHHQVPAIVQHLAHVAADVPVAGPLGSQQIAAPCVVAGREEGIAHDAAEFAADEHAKGSGFGHISYSG